MPAPAAQAQPREAPASKRPATPPVEAPAQSSGHPGGPVRQATRYAFRAEIDVQIDGGPGHLIDLSLTGCQLRSPAALKPNRIVRLLLPFEGKPIACTGKVVWARLEPPSKGRPLGYRAGVQFTKADEPALEAFAARHVATA